MLLVIMLLYTKHKKFDGEIFLIYLIGYGIGRVWIEGLRTDQLQIGATGIAVSQVLSGVLAVGGYFLQKFLNSTDNSQSEIYAMPAQMGSIQSKVSGSGSAKSKESAAITLSSSGTVEEVFVNSGDIVTEGQPLYTIFSQAAQDKVTEAQKQVDKLNGEMQKLSESVGKLWQYHIEGSDHRCLGQIDYFFVFHFFFSFSFVFARVTRRTFVMPA